MVAEEDDDGAILLAAIAQRGEGAADRGVRQLDGRVILGPVATDDWSVWEEAGQLHLGRGNADALRLAIGVGTMRVGDVVEQVPRRRCGRSVEGAGRCV